MTDATKRTYRVVLNEWASYKTFVEADSAADAIAQAEALFINEGPEAFSLGETGFDEAFAEDVGP